MKVITLSNDKIEENEYDNWVSRGIITQYSKDIIWEFEKWTEISTDMDWVILFDDSARDTVWILAWEDGFKQFWEYADLNLIAADDGIVPYCRYAPTVYLNRLLEWRSPEILRIVGEHGRTIPDVKEYFESMKDLKYNMTIVTAWPQEWAEAVGERVWVSPENVIWTKIWYSNGEYDAHSIDRFVWGKHKYDEVKKILKKNPDFSAGTHIGDSWSDVYTLAKLSNSVAFNPWCMKALIWANFSIISESKLGVLPLFDYKWEFIDSYKDKLPETLIINKITASKTIDSKVEEKLQELYQESRTMKKETIKNNLDETKEEMQKKIIQELNRENIQYKTKQTTPLSNEEFDILAKTLYQESEFSS